MSNRLIDIVDITKSYGDSVILDQLNLYIRENEFLTLLGPSAKHRFPKICSFFPHDNR
jgi:spermidine/putrescine transport system ATP-binding protein